MTIIVLCKDHNDRDKFFELNPNLKESDEVFIHFNEAKAGYGIVANMYFDIFESFAFVHYDVSLTNIDNLIRECEAGNLTGIIGRALNGDYVWGKDITEPKEVSTLDACALFIPKTEVRFDTDTFDSFHCVAEDFCLQWKKETGKPILIHPSQTDHIGSLTFTDEAWREQYWHYRDKLDKKWEGEQFMTT